MTKFPTLMVVFKRKFFILEQSSKLIILNQTFLVEHLILMGGYLLKRLLEDLFC